MNEIMEEFILEGLAGLRQLLAGKHLRPAQLASTMVAINAAPQAAADVVFQFGKESGMTQERMDGT